MQQSIEEDGRRRALEHFQGRHHGLQKRADRRAAVGLLERVALAPRVEVFFFVPYGKGHVVVRRRVATHGRRAARADHVLHGHLAEQRKVAEALELGQAGLSVGPPSFELGCGLAASGFEAIAGDLRE